MLTSEDFNKGGAEHLPGLLGIEITAVSATTVRGRLPVRPALMAPNGYLHAGSVVSLADTCAGYGCIANLPPGAVGFTTIELKSNHLGTMREGTIECVATPVHLGKVTQVWDSVVSDTQSGRVLALFRCTQLVLRAK
ncbi:MAG TPA: PaaI family thioesterase [Steroidobacteraceae bacterium]|jgi:uncharacterized protein (TIGR00369 family)